MGGIITESQRQDSNILPPRKGNQVAQTADTTGRAYDLRALAFNGQTYKANYDEELFLDIINDGTNPIYVQFAPDNVVTMAPATVTAAGTPMALSNTACRPIPAGQFIPVRINRNVDQFIHVQTTGGTSTLRIAPSSDSSPQPA